MKRAIILIFSVLILIGIDMSSKYYVENFLSYDLCIRENQNQENIDTFYSNNNMIGGYYPSLLCSSEYDNSLLSIYEKLLQEDGVHIVGEWIMIKLSYNEGVAFSLPIRGLTLQILTIILIIGIIYQYIHEEYSKKSRLIDIGYILILAGALSHGYERIFIGHVVDFIAVKYFAILNFADIFISTGAVILIFYYIYYGKTHSR